MALIVAVHGIGQEMKGESTLHARWLPALRDGLKRAGAEPLADTELACAFYGDLFRPAGKPLGPAWEAEDVGGDWEASLLLAWWEEASRIELAVSPPGERGKARTPGFVQDALAALSGSTFFAGLGDRLLIGSLKQVHLYLHDDETRAAVQARIAAAVSPTTRVVVGHSLGSVAAYEALVAHPEWRVHTFVTLGSPLGIRNLVFDRLRPPPVEGRGEWPGGLERWVNVADRGDVVALAKSLAPLFRGAVDDRRVDNGATAHDVEPYLTSVEVGRAVAAGLSG